MDNERFIFLLARYQQYGLQGVEYREFMEYVRDERFEKMIDDEILADLSSKLKDDSWTATQKEKVWDQIVQKTTETQRPVYYMRRRKWITAAACIFLIGSGLYVYFNRSARQIPLNEVSVHQDIAPGANKAILTLSNGSKIILDSARMGLLANQNGVSVIKSDSGLLSYTVNEKLPTTSYNTLTTPRGGQYQLTLPDGTKVWLNAASSITYPTAFNGNERKVQITGEAYFEVVHNSKMPFRVKASDQMVEDIGTDFNIEAYADGASTKTTLLKGSVRVTPNAQQSTSNNPRPLILTPGEQARVENDKVKVVAGVDVDQVTAWKNGAFNFQNEDLAEVLRQLSRWYDVEVVYDGKPNDQKFYGQLHRNLTLGQVLHALEKTGVLFKVEGRVLHVLNE